MNLVFVKLLSLLLDLLHDLLENVNSRKNMSSNTAKQKHNNMGSMFANPFVRQVEANSVTTNYDPGADDAGAIVAQMFNDFVADSNNADKVIVGCHAVIGGVTAGVVIYTLTPDA